jgi:hypothetical protein
MPKQFAAVGDRLVFSNGIVGLAIGAITLVVFFNGSTHHLIPLYAIGVFTAFSLSQWGMVHYWLKKPAEQWVFHGKVLLNGSGALVTTIALCITFEAKFYEGAYLVMVAVPVLMWMFHSIHKHYMQANALLGLSGHRIKTERIFSTLPNRTMIVPISKMHKGAVEALAFAREMSTDVTAILVDVNHVSVVAAKEKIESLGWNIHVEILPSPYRSIIDPIVRYVHHIDHHRQELAVLILPELVLVRWWQGFLHNNTAKAIASALTWSEPLPGRARIIITVPYYLKV